MQNKCGDDRLAEQEQQQPNVRERERPSEQTRWRDESNDVGTLRFTANLVQHKQQSKRSIEMAINQIVKLRMLSNQQQTNK